MIAEPVAARPDLFVPVLGSANWPGDLNAIITRPLGRPMPPYAPDIDYLHYPIQRAHGAAWTSDGFELDGRASTHRDEEYLLEVGFTEGGGVRLFCGRGSDTRKEFPLMPEEAAPPQLIIDNLVIGWSYRVTGMAQAISEVTGFTGMWDFAVGLTGLRGGLSPLLR